MARKDGSTLRGAQAPPENPNAAFFNEDGSPKRLMWCSDDVRVGWNKGIDVPCPFTGEKAKYLPKGGCCKMLTDRPFGGISDVNPRKDSWAAVGIDTSPTAIAAVAYGYDAITKQHKGPYFGEIRWMPEVEFIDRLVAASKTDALVNSLVSQTWARNPDKTFIAIEEPVHFGAIQRGIGAHIVDQAQIGGVVKASLACGGYENIREIGNTQWRKTLREAGVEFHSYPKGISKSERAKLSLANKFKVKEAMIELFDLPDMPDLVKSKSGAKIPRPDSGFGANAVAVQPSDIYDAAAVCVWLIAWLEEEGHVTTADPK